MRNLVAETDAESKSASGFLRRVSGFSSTITSRFGRQGSTTYLELSNPRARVQDHLFAFESEGRAPKSHYCGNEMPRQAQTRRMFESVAIESRNERTWLREESDKILSTLSPSFRRFIRDSPKACINEVAVRMP